MNILKIVNGKIEIRDAKNGNLKRTIVAYEGKAAVSANFNSDQSLIIITTVNGKVEIRDTMGNQKKIYAIGDAVSASWMGDDIAIQTSKGKTEIRDAKYGNLKRTI